MNAPKTSPWGKVQHTTELVPGKAWVVHTAGHGGIKLHRELNHRIPVEWRDFHSYHPMVGWYEEDCAWAIPYYFIPELPWHGSNGDRQSIVEATLRHYYPRVFQYAQAVD